MKAPAAGNLKPFVLRHVLRLYPHLVRLHYLEAPVLLCILVFPYDHGRTVDLPAMLNRSVRNSGEDLFNIAHEVQHERKQVGAVVQHDPVAAVLLGVESP